MDGMEVLYNILIEFSVAEELVKLMEMCLDGICVGRSLTETFSLQNILKQRYALRALLFASSLTEEGLRKPGRTGMTGTHQLLIHAVALNLFDENTNTIKKNTEGLSENFKEVGLEVREETIK
jgi:hypothetical protein